jgi:uncharacterized protein
VTDATAADPLLIARLRAAVVKSAPVRLAILFGSTASGRMRPDSDIDVAILGDENGVDDSQELDLTRALALAGKAEVDLIRIERASTLLKWQIAIRGVPLYESSPGEFARFRARAASEYIDFAPALAYYGEIFGRRLIEQGRGQ